MRMYLADGPLDPALDQYLFFLSGVNQAYEGCESVVANCKLQDP